MYVCMYKVSVCHRRSLLPEAQAVSCIVSPKKVAVSVIKRLSAETFGDSSAQGHDKQTPYKYAYGINVSQQIVCRL